LCVDFWSRWDFLIGENSSVKFLETYCRDRESNEVYRKMT
jgi:hypothetical protein